MTGFLGGNVVVEEVDDTNWLLREPYEYQAAGRLVHVPVCQPTDFASVPRVFVWLLPRYGRYTKAAIMHDHLWRDLTILPDTDPNSIAVVDADAMFRHAMGDLGVPFLKRWFMWGAVRWGALVKPGGRKGWLKEAPRVLLLTLLAIPIVAVPALVILVALALFFVLELIVWVPLKLVQLYKQSHHTGPVKPAIRPSFTWKL